jgi:DNA-binding protein HU-beta
VVAVRQPDGFNNNNLKGGSERMTKAELVSVMAGGAGITKAAAAAALETYVATIAKETIKIPAKKVVKFKAGKALSEKAK